MVDKIPRARSTLLFKDFENPNEVGRSKDPLTEFFELGGRLEA